MNLTIAYMTCRKNPRFDWFYQSLKRECSGDFSGIDILVVDFYAGEVGRKKELGIHHFNKSIKLVEPKPCVWQGKNRLTKENWFAASNSRNTALCYAKDGWIAYVDDLSVLLPGWLNRVREAMKSNKVVLGAYQKVKNLVVEKGNIVSFEKGLNGIDSRWDKGGDAPVIAAGSWLFGCSLAGPLECFLRVGGWPEFCDGLGGEDTTMGMAMENAGVEFIYDRMMLTYESEELHHEETHFKRTDKGVSPNDKSHAAVRMVQGKMKYFENYYAGGIPKLRQDIQAGMEMPPCGIPQHDWFDGQPISEMI